MEKDLLKDNERENLFDEWKTLGLDISFQLAKIEALKAIIQNPVDIPEDQIQEWREVAFQNWVDFRNITEQFLIDYRDLVKRVLDHLRETKNNCLSEEQAKEISNTLRTLR